MKVVSVTIEYTTGGSVTYTRQHQYEKYIRQPLKWAKFARRTKLEQEEYDEEYKRIVDHLNNIDPSIFPENLFGDDTTH